jgi:hypothetical protein
MFANLWASLYKIYYKDNSGSLDKSEVFQLLQVFNNWFEGEEKYFQVDTSKYDFDGDGELQYDEFEAMMIDLTTKFGKDEFDEMFFRLFRCIDSLKATGAGQEQSFKQHLAQMVKQASQVQPLLLYGSQIEPSQAIERLALASKVEVKGVVVSSPSSEESTLSLIRCFGMGKGKWLYVVMFPDYHNTDAFLRSLTLALETTPIWMVHQRFRLFIILQERYVWWLPRTFLSHCLAVPLDDSVHPEAEDS